MSTPTPIEIVREHQRWRRAQGQYAGLCQCPHTPEEIGLALDSVLRDAERFKRLQEGHDNGTWSGWCEWSPDADCFQRTTAPLAEIADWPKAARSLPETLAEIAAIRADRLREGAT